jgi:hypothetical protein
MMVKKKSEKEVKNGLMDLLRRGFLGFWKFFSAWRRFLRVEVGFQLGFDE